VPYEVLVGKYDGKRPLGRSKRRWDDNIKVDLKLVRRMWTELLRPTIRAEWQAVVNTVMDLRVL
jgi:hypothetical protein